MIKKSKISLTFTGMITFLIIGFQNCAGPGESQSDKNSSSQSYTWLLDPPPSGLSAVNYFSEAPPADMSGKAGYTYLYNQYFRPKCFQCHQPVSGLGPQFVSSNINTSYDIASTTFDTLQILSRVTHNSACPECDLDPQSEVYQAIRFWLENRF